MEKEVKAKKSTKAIDKADKIKQSFIDFILEEGHQPPTVYKFMKGLRMNEATFYDYYASFEALEKHIWGDYIMEVSQMLEADEAYQAYNGREKMLAFYFTLIEVLKNHRSFVSISFKKYDKPGPTPAFLKFFKNNFNRLVRDILLEARETDEVVDRPLIGDKYEDALWVQLLFVLKFWINDDSKGFEKTDAAIEKAVHVAFDLMGKSPIDSILDFAKFLYQNQKN